MNDLTPRKPVSRLVSRSGVHLALVAAVTSYWLQFLIPLLACLTSGRILSDLLSLSTASTARWGGWWTVSLFVSFSWFTATGIFFLILCLRIPRIWRRSFGVMASPPGLRLDVGEAPELFDLTSRFYREAGLQHKPEIWVDLSANATNVAYRMPAGSKLRRAIVIGLPPLGVMSRADLDSLVGLNIGAVSISHYLCAWAVSLRAFAAHSPPVFTYLFFFRIDCFKLTGYLCNKALTCVETYAFQVASRDGGNPKLAGDALRRIGGIYQRFWAEHGQMMLQWTCRAF
jgi:hypothetical protein